MSVWSKESERNRNNCSDFGFSLRKFDFVAKSFSSIFTGFSTLGRGAVIQYS